MRHCKGCSHPTICNTHGCAAEESKANKARESVTVTMGRQQMPDGSWTATMMVSGLTDERMADAAMAHMERLFCGAEIKGRH